MKGKYPELEDKMSKTLKVLEKDYAAVRAGRANPSILDKVKVNYYGTDTPVNQVAAVSVPEARVLAIQPWEQTMVREVIKAINQSDIGINPTDDGKIIRLVFPPLNEERRRELVKQVSTMAEGAKVSIRSIRRDAIEKFKAQKKSSEITEDDYKYIEKDMQELTELYTKKIDDAAALKEKELSDM